MLVVRGVVDGRAVKGAHNHVGKGHEDGNDDGYGNESSRGRSVFRVFVIAEKLVSIKKITRFQQLFQILKQSHRLLSLLYIYNMHEIGKK